MDVLDREEVVHRVVIHKTVIFIQMVDQLNAISFKSLIFLFIFIILIVFSFDFNNHLIAISLRNKGLFCFSVDRKEPAVETRKA